jgi:carboxyl-terminal processing protease
MSHVVSTPSEQLSEPLPRDPEPHAEAHGFRWSILVAVFLIAAIGGGALFVSGFGLGRLAGATPGTPDDRQELFRPFWDAFNDISNNYVGEVDPNALVQGAIKGLFESLKDPYSSYMTEAEYRASLSGLSGQFEGIGVEMTTMTAAGQACETVSDDCSLVITKVIRGSPAIAAGFMANDVIVAVDDVSTEGRTVGEVVDTIRGPRGTNVTVTILRDEATMLDIDVKRDVIQREDVHAEAIAGGRVGYIKVDGFSSGSADDLRNLVGGLLADDGVDALVLDLRDDPGGYVDAAQKIASEFVGDRPLYYEQLATGEPIPQQPTPGGVATDRRIPMAVLVNGGTASASEIVAAALQRNDRAVLVGSTTYGKGTIQEFKELPGAGGYRLSVRKWLTPDQEWIHDVGLQPDITVEPPADVQAGEDPVLDRAVEHLLDELANPIAA